MTDIKRAPRQIALTIAGYDPSSGAGITADLATFSAHDLYGISCITALTVQSTFGVQRVKPLPPEWIGESLDCLEADLPPAGIKVGMLGSREAVLAVAEYLRDIQLRRRVFVVLDPVLRSSSGAALLESGALGALRDDLLPLCDAATPNRAELFNLLGEDHGGEQIIPAAHRLQELLRGGELVVTGGDEARPDDLLINPAGEQSWLRGQRVDTTSTHGTGCAFSSSFLCQRLWANRFEEAARAAKRYVEGALRSAPGLGSGRGPMNLLWPRKMSSEISSG